MGMTVRNIQSLPVAHDFHLVAGEHGLSKELRHVNLLDFEYDTFVPDAKETDGLFDQKSIIITSLLFAKGKPEKILPVIKQLHVDGVSAVAIKKVYYQSLPDDVLLYAEQQKIPIFLFDSEKNFSENVVVGLTKAIDNYNDLDMLEEKMSFLMYEHPGATNRRSMLQELFPGLYDEYYCYYLLHKKESSTFAFQHEIVRLRERSESDEYVYPYDGGIVAVSPHKMSVTELCAHFSLPIREYICGISGLQHSREELVNTIREAVCAAEYAARKEHGSAVFTDIGIWQILLPNKDNYWMRNYCRMVLEKLRAQEEGDDFYKTVACYVKNDCNIAIAAQELSVHKNTVRYRLGKAKQILGMEDSDSLFQETIVLAVLFDDICG